MEQSKSPVGTADNNIFGDAEGDIRTWVPGGICLFMHHCSKYLSLNSQPGEFLTSTILHGVNVTQEVPSTKYPLPLPSTKTCPTVQLLVHSVCNYVGCLYHFTAREHKMTKHTLDALIKFANKLLSKGQPEALQEVEAC